MPNIQIVNKKKSNVMCNIDNWITDNTQVKCSVGGGGRVSYDIWQQF